MFLRMVPCTASDVQCSHIGVDVVARCLSDGSHCPANVLLFGKASCSGGKGREY